MFIFPELTETRERMLGAFREEQERTDLAPYRPDALTPVGIEAFAGLMEAAILHGNEMTLMHELDFAPFWNKQRVAPASEARRVASTEFNTWYVRGLCLRLMDEGAESCGVFEAEAAAESCDECLGLAGRALAVEEVYDGHRIRYHHLAPDPAALSVPAHSACHHSIKRLG